MVTEIEPGWYRVIDGMNRAFAIIGGLACFLLAMNVVADVLGRFLFNAPITATLDITTYAWMPTLIGLGFGYALLRNEHIRVTLITGSTSAGLQRVVEMISMAAVAMLALALAYYGAEMAVMAMAYQESADTTQWLAIWPFRWVLIVGLVGLAAQAIVEFLRALRANSK